MMKIEFMLNGKKTEVFVEPNMRLLDVLRNTLHLTGSKEGCGEGECGACSVLIDHHVANSCLIPVANVANKQIMTIEGFAKTKRFAVLKEAFASCGAVQCGICTPGMIIAAESLLHHNPHPTIADIKIGLAGNLCRCTGYQMIIDAIVQASKVGEGLW